MALVNGAAREQGRALAVGLAREGAAVIAVDICGPLETVAYRRDAGRSRGRVAAAEAVGRITAYMLIA